MDLNAATARGADAELAAVEPTRSCDEGPVHALGCRVHGRLRGVLEHVVRPGAPLVDKEMHVGGESP